MLRAPRFRAIVVAGLLVSSLTAALPSSSTSTTAAPADRGGRLVVLGFDGADGRTVEEMMDAGQLPNMRALRDEGTFTRLGIISPPESPVSWASLNTGQNPAKTGVPGFVMRENKPFGPFPAMGHLVTGDYDTENMEGVPIPLWSAGTMAGVAGGAILVAFLIVFAGLLRMRFPLALGLSVVLGGVGGWAGYKVRGYIPDQIPRTTNPNKARNFWDYAADAGVESVVLEAAQAFDQKTPPGAKVLAGLGVPDARGKIGDWFVYTNDDLEFEKPPKGRSTGTAGTVFKVDEYDGRIETKVYGPTNFWREEQIAKEIAAIDEKLATPGVDPAEQLELGGQKRALADEKDAVKKEPVSVDLVIERQESNRANVTIDNQTQSLSEGEWSDWYNLSFELNTLLKVNAVTRVKLMEYDDDNVSLFVSQLHLDPASPPFWQPVSQPPSFSSELVSVHGGPFETYGWPTLTMPFKDKIIDAVTLLEDVQFTTTWRDELTMKMLDRDDWRLFMSVFSTTDRVQHMMYQYYDQEHPMYDPEEAGRTVDFFGEEITFSQAVPKIYERMDDIIGRVAAKLGPDDTLLVCSDHGFQSFRRQVHVNNWLAEKGYLAVKRGVKKSQNSVLGFVDWSNTKAYAMGLGFIYLNLHGREKEGIVDPSEADFILRSIRNDLLESTDPATGAAICTDAYIVSEIHNGPHLDMEADLICGFAPTYRVSWSTTMGGMSLVEEDGSVVPGPVVVDNTSPWSGGHVSVDTEAVAGVFFSNRKVDLGEEGVHQLDLAPTALAVVGVTPPAEMDRGPITFLE